MILEVLYSVSGVPIRLTEERWEHITGKHLYMTSYYEDSLEALEDPEYILRGHRGTLVAVRSSGRRRYLHVVYREMSRADGFIVTAYIKPAFNRKLIVWRREDQ